MSIDLGSFIEDAIRNSLRFLLKAPYYTLSTGVPGRYHDGSDLPSFHDSSAASPIGTIDPTRTGRPVSPQCLLLMWAF